MGWQRIFVHIINHLRVIQHHLPRQRFLQQIAMWPVIDLVGNLIIVFYALSNLKSKRVVLRVVLNKQFVLTV